MLVVNDNKGEEPENPEKNSWDDSTSFAIQRSILSDTRSFEAEMWGESGYTFLTYRFPKQGLENLSKAQVVQYLSTQDVSIDLVKFPLESISFSSDSNDSVRYSLTLTIGESDD